MTGRKIRGMIYPRTRTNVLVLAPDPLQESDIRADVFSFAPWAVPYFHRGAWGWAQPGEPPLAVQMGRAMARRLLPSACPPLAPPIRPSRGGRGRPLSVLRGRVGEPVHGPENAPGTGREVSISSLDPAFGQAPRSREKQRPSAKAAVSDKKRRSKDTFTPAWWRRVDSNHRSETQQIYSLPPLATRELLHMKLWSWWTDSNPRPADYKSAALPAELHQQLKSAVQQQVLFYQKAYTLSTTFFKFFFFLFLPLIRPLRPSPLRRGGRLFQSKGGGAPREC